MPSPPKKGFSKEKTKERSFGKKILDASINVMDKALNIVPFVASARYENKQYVLTKKIESPLRYALKSYGLQTYNAFSSLLIGTWAFSSFFTGEINPKKQLEFFNSKQQHKYQINSAYNSIVKERVDDTTFVNLLNKYVPSSEKEKIINQNSLEGKTFGKEIKIDAE